MNDELYERNMDALRCQWKRKSVPSLDIERNVELIRELRAEIAAMRNNGQHEPFDDSNSLDPKRSATDGSRPQTPRLIRPEITTVRRGRVTSRVSSGPR